MQQRKMAPILKITIDLVICSIFEECRKDRVFSVICEVGLTANKSQIIHNFARFVVRQTSMGFRVTAAKFLYTRLLGNNLFIQVVTEYKTSDA